MFSVISTYKNMTDWVVWNIFMFPYIGNNHPNWLFFFRGVGSTSNQIIWWLKPPTLGRLQPLHSGLWMIPCAVFPTLKARSDRWRGRSEFASEHRIYIYIHTCRYLNDIIFSDDEGMLVPLVVSCQFMIDLQTSALHREIHGPGPWLQPPKLGTKQCGSSFLSLIVQAWVLSESGQVGHKSTSQHRCLKTIGNHLLFNQIIIRARHLSTPSGMAWRCCRFPSPSSISKKNIKMSRILLSTY